MSVLEIILLVFYLSSVLSFLLVFLSGTEKDGTALLISLCIVVLPPVFLIAIIVSCIQELKNSKTKKVLNDESNILSVEEERKLRK